MRHHVDVLVDLGEIALAVHPVDDELARGETVEAHEHRHGALAIGLEQALQNSALFANRDRRVRRQNGDARQPVPFTDLEIVEIVRGVIFTAPDPASGSA